MTSREDLEERALKLFDMFGIPEKYMDEFIEMCEKVRKKWNFLESVTLIDTYIPLLSVLYVFCKKKRIPRRLKEFKKQLPYCNVFKYYRKVSRKLGVPITPFRVEEWIPRVLDIFCNERDVDRQELFDNMSEMNNELKESNVQYDGNMGKSPFSTTVALLYISLLQNDEKVSKERIGDIFDIGEETITRNMESIVNKLNLSKKKLQNHLTDKVYVGNDKEKLLEVIKDEFGSKFSKAELKGKVQTDSRLETVLKHMEDEGMIRRSTKTRRRAWKR